MVARIRLSCVDNRTRGMVGAYDVFASLRADQLGTKNTVTLTSPFLDALGLK